MRGRDRSQVTLFLEIPFAGGFISIILSLARSSSKDFAGRYAIDRQAEIELLKDHRGLFAFVESWLSGVLAVLLLFEAAIGMLIIVFMESANFHVTRWVSVPMLVIVVSVNATLIARIWDTLTMERRPMPIFLADRYMPMGGLARSFYTLAWGTYSALGLVGAFAMASAVERLLGEGEFAAFGMFVLSYGMSFLANLFIVLFLAAITGELDASRAFWKRRFLIDLAMSGTLMVAALLSSGSTR